MRRPIQPPIAPTPCPKCGTPCRGHVLSGWCPACAGLDARDAIALRLALLRRRAPEVPD